MSSVYVTNKNDFLHQDRYDGEDYFFPPGETVLLPVDAAVHLFGYGLKDKTEVLVRLGWAMRYDTTAKNYVEDETGVQRLAGFVFEQAVLSRASALRPAPVVENLEIA